MSKKQFIRICLEILGGIVLSVALYAALIFWGYYHINSAQLSEYVVKFIGLPIYEITHKAGELTGTALNQNMSIIGIMCSMILIIVVETIQFLKKRN